MKLSATVGADTVDRQLDPSEYERTWYRPNPPWPQVRWSQRNNQNYTQSGLLTALSYFARHDRQFLRNFWLKSKGAIQKAQGAGPVAWVLPADAPRPSAQAALVRVLRAQHVELHQLSRALTVKLPAAPGASVAEAVDRILPAGSIVVRMDQPYSRIADTLLDRQYWSPEDPQKHPYDDTAWSLPDLYGTEAVRILDPALLKSAMQALPPSQPVADLEGRQF